MSGFQTIADRLALLPQVGEVVWIGLRPARHAAMRTCVEARAEAGRGLLGDRTAERGSAKRQVTLLQFEHLGVLASLCGRESVEAELLRRNLIVSGINLLALRNRLFMIGDVLLEGTGPCDPCSRMEAALGPGGLNAMRGHGGITARVLQSGDIRVGHPVRIHPASPVTGSGGTAGNSEDPA